MKTLTLLFSLLSLTAVAQTQTPAPTAKLSCTFITAQAQKKCDYGFDAAKLAALPTGDHSILEISDCDPSPFSIKFSYEGTAQSGQLSVDYGSQTTGFPLQKGTSGSSRTRASTNGEGYDCTLSAAN